MQAIIKFDENGQLAVDTIKYIAETEKKLKEAKEQEEQMKAQLLEAMEQNGIIKIENDNVLINYVAPTESERLDAKAFKENCPDLYDEFVKFSPVKASIRIKVKQ